MPTVNDEIVHREQLWKTLVDSGGPNSVLPILLRQLGIYGGAQGIWVDKERTIALTPDGNGVAVGLLHTSSVYPDELSDNGIIYHYPVTERPGNRDQSEVTATKASGDLSVPIFLITRPAPNSNFRDVHKGWVEGWDDRSQQFWISFEESPPEQLITSPSEGEPFTLHGRQSERRTQTVVRPEQQRFRFLVFQRYGPRCAVCDVEIIELLEAAHIIPTAANGSDDPRNGLVLCALHHKAFDSCLFGIEPQSRKLHYRRSGPNDSQLKITKQNLNHLTLRPHDDALKWAWRKYTQYNRVQQ